MGKEISPQLVLQKLRRRKRIKDDLVFIPPVVLAILIILVLIFR
jgi:hypothetical protein